MAPAKTIALDDDLCSHCSCLAAILVHSFIWHGPCLLSRNAQVVVLILLNMSSLQDMQVRLTNATSGSTSKSQSGVCAIVRAQWASHTNLSSRFTARCTSLSSPDWPQIYWTAFVTEVCNYKCCLDTSKLLLGDLALFFTYCQLRFFEVSLYTLLAFYLTYNPLVCCPVHHQDAFLYSCHLLDAECFRGICRSNVGRLEQEEVRL